MKVFFIMLGVILITGCVNRKQGPTSEEYSALQKELMECKNENESLKNTPQVRLSKGQKLFSENKYDEAITELNALIKNFPGTDEADKATNLVVSIEKTKEDIRINEERKKTLGFKMLKESNVAVVDDVTLNFSTVTTGNRWVFDSYDDEYRYRSSERGDIFVLSKVSISSGSKDPKLPPITIFKASGGKLIWIGTLGYEFSRWEDYGSYLGNDADFGNDFAHTKTIPFSCGLSISVNVMNESPVFVVVKKTHCFYRFIDQLGNPPVKYIAGDCKIKNELTIDDFDSEYILVKIFNKNKL